jgi:LPXTG-motif cell wall-anchored protein
MDKILKNVKGWKDLSAASKAYAVFSITLALIWIVFSFSKDFQDAVVSFTGWNFLTSPATSTIFWLVWMAFGHNTVTVSFALIEKLNWSGATLAGGLFIAGVISLGAAVGIALKYIWDNTGNSAWLIIAGIVIAIGAFVWYRIRKH